MEIRELKAKDVRTLAKILGQLKPTSIDNLLIILGKKKSNLMEIGLSVFHIAAADLTDDIYAWLADLIGKPIEELDNMPVSTPANIIRELMNRGDFKDFFGSVSQKAERKEDSTT